jgi:hypothetical protein
VAGIGAAAGEVSGEPATVDTQTTISAEAGSIPWRGVTGVFKTALGEVTLENGLVLNNVRGDLSLGATSLKLDSVSADLRDGGNFTFDGQLNYSGGVDRPFALTGKMQAEQVEVGALLRRFDPLEQPVMDGAFNFTANLSSEAAHLETLADSLQFDARVTSTGGVLRALGVDISKMVQAGKTVAALGSIFAALNNDSRVGNYAAKLQAATQVAEQLSLLAFDQLNLELSRTTSGDLQLRDLSIISPGLRLLGNGGIQHRDGVPLWLQPLTVRLQMSAREQMATDLAALNLLRTEADALGYLPLVQSVNLSGNLSVVNTDSIRQLLIRALNR